MALVFLCVRGHGEWLSAITLFGLAYASMLVPHGFAMCMGRGDVLQCRWFTKPLVFLIMPSLYGKLKDETGNGIMTADWTETCIEDRISLDFFQMEVIGLIRGLIVFTPLSLIGFFVYGHDYALLNGLSAVVVISFLQALAYLVGNYFPFSIGESLIARTATWGEFFDGIAWGCALLLFMVKS
jgi:hypothetical protein